MPVPKDNQLKQSLKQIRRSSQDLSAALQKHQSNLEKLLDQLVKRIAN